MPLNIKRIIFLFIEALNFRDTKSSHLQTSPAKRKTKKIFYWQLPLSRFLPKALRVNEIKYATKKSIEGVAGILWYF